MTCTIELLALAVGDEMSTTSLQIEELLLDLQNPRFAQATGQRDVLQKIVDDQGGKLVALAESIVENGLNPMDRLLVIPSQEEADRFIVIEGNRRFAAIKILHNPPVLTGLSVRPSVRKRFEALAATFDVTSVEPLDCFEVVTREEGAQWIQQRHTGENGGRGIVNWSGVATARFRGNDPALQALDFVLKHGGFSEDEKAEAIDSFPISTFDRLLSTPAVRDIIGVEIVNGKLLTGLPLDEILRPLQRVVRDLATTVVTVTNLKRQPQMVAYVDGLGSDLPDLSKLTTTTVAVEDLRPQKEPTGDLSGARGDSTADGGGTPPSRKQTKRRTPERKTLIDRTSRLNVTNAKVAEIEKELRTLTFSEYPHAISVLLRVF